MCDLGLNVLQDRRNSVGRGTRDVKCQWLLEWTDFATAFPGRAWLFFGGGTLNWSGGNCRVDRAPILPIAVGKCHSHFHVSPSLRGGRVLLGHNLRISDGNARSFTHTVHRRESGEQTRPHCVCEVNGREEKWWMDVDGRKEKISGSLASAPSSTAAIKSLGYE